MECIITYGSLYGTTKSYAEKFSELTGFPVFQYEAVSDLMECDVVIHFGSLYEGGVRGLRGIVGKISEDTRLVVVTVGLTDVSREQTVQHIRETIRSQIPSDRYDDSLMFHLRGGIDYRKLTIKDKATMALLCMSLKRQSPEQLSEDDRLLIEHYNDRLSFVDFDRLPAIQKKIKQALSCSVLVK